MGSDSKRKYSTNTDTDSDTDTETIGATAFFTPVKRVQNKQRKPNGAIYTKILTLPYPKN